MHKTIAYILAALALATLLMPGQAISKPGLPVTVTLVPVAPVTGYSGGEVVELEAVITAVRSMSVMVEFRLLGGVELLSGEGSLEMDLLPGRAERISITLRLPKGGKGSVRVAVRDAGKAKGRGFAARALYRFGTATKEPSGAPARVHDSEGRKIIEYRR